MGILKLKQTTQDGRSKVWKLDSSQSLHTFGLSRKATIVSIDSSHGAFRAAFEHHNNEWHFIQFDPKNDIPDTLITNNSVINLETSKLEFTVSEIQPFIQSSLDNFQSQGQEKLKLLLVTNSGQLLKTEVQPLNHQFSYLINGDLKKINFKLSDEWQTQTFENYTFKSKIMQTFVNGNLVYDKENFNEGIKGKRLTFEKER